MKKNESHSPIGFNIPDPNLELLSARFLTVEKQFMQGKAIFGDELIVLCALNDIECSDHDKMLLQTYVVEVANNGNLVYLRPEGLPKLRLDSIHELAKRVYNTLNIKNSIDNIINK